MEPPLTVREAKLDDAATIARLSNVVQGLHYGAFPERFHEPDEARVAQVYRQMLASTGTATTAQTRAWLCVDDNDEAVGYVLAVVRERPENAFTTFNEGARAFFNSLGFEPLWHRQSLRLPTSKR